ncbi:MAG TPA: hypothetical protein VFP68_20300 [Burkholderiaceae bacterium]|nr:hypothetical protein [Burkholderiaceae bacterium]
MRDAALQALTWGTVASAITSALWLATVEPVWPEVHQPADAALAFRLPTETAGAGSATFTTTGQQLLHEGRSASKHKRASH